MPLERDVCPVCNGSTWAPIPETTQVQRCACFYERTTRTLLTGAGIPAKYAHCTFENYQTYNNTLVDALAIARAYADRFPLTREKGDAPGLIFIGPAGVGKTHLAAAILTTIIRRMNAVALFYKTRDLLRLLRASYNPAIQTTETQILNPILTCQFLVLDDLGAERTTEWVDEVMNSIVDTRYSENRPLVCTSNFPDVDDSTEVNGLVYRVGFRMQSRLREMCLPVILDGADYRNTDGSEAQLRREWRKRRAIPPARDLRPGPRPTPKDGKADLKWPGGRGGNAR